MSILRSIIFDFSRRAAFALTTTVAMLAGINPTQNAVANGDTRSLNLYHSHTGESLTITFRRDGAYDRAALEKLNWFLRDWRKDEPTSMDPRLFDVIWATYREVGSSSTIKIVSAYRSPSTNAMLRRPSSAVSKNSQHMQGKAMDFHLPDVSMAKVREMGMRLQAGGVGYYPTAGTPFVHLDVGSVRSWPRMPRPQLERLFPDGKTVHLPADGRPLPGYELALADIEARGGSAISFADVSSPRRSLWAALFGGEDEETEVIRPAKQGRGKTAVAARQNTPAQQVASAQYAPSDSASVFINTAPVPPAPVGVASLPARVATPPRPTPVAEPATTDEARETAPAARLPAKIDEKSPEKPADKPVILQASLLPTPPRRPGDLQQIAALNAAHAVDMPVPPIRPSMMALAQEPIEPAPAVQQMAKASTMPVPVPRPVITASISGSAPLAADHKTVPAAINAGEQRTALAFAGAKTPSAQAAAQKFPMKFDQNALRDAMGNASTANDRPKVTEKVAMPSVKQAVGSAIVAGKFSGNQSPPASNGFSGSLYRPLSAGFVSKGE